MRPEALRRTLRFCVLLGTSIGLLRAQGADVPTAASWLWYPENPAVEGVRQTRYFRKSFTLPAPPVKAVLRVLCDDSCELRVNGSKPPAPFEQGKSGRVYDLTHLLHPGRNVLAFRVYNAVGRGGLLVSGTVKTADGAVLRIRSDPTFRVARSASAGWDAVTFDDSDWLPAHIADSAFGEPWFSHPAFDVAPFIEPADWRKWNAWRERVLAVPPELAGEKPSRAKFAFPNGSCALLIDGIARPPFIYRGTVDPLSRHGRRQIALFREAGVHVYAAYMPLAGCWPKPGVYEFDRLDDLVRGYLSADPDARLILILRLVPPDWWMDAHPEEIVHYAAGDDFNSTDECGRVRRASLASKVWLQDMLSLWRAAVRHLEDRPWGKRIIGYQPGYGIYTEWHYFGSWTNQMPDTGPAMTAHFREWLRAKYGTVEQLRRAWGQPEVTFDTAVVPGVSARLAAGPLGLRRPVQDRMVMDYYHCQQEVTADDIAAFCSAAKDETGGRVLCGAFYGYFYGVPPQTQGGHLELERLLKSPVIDYFAAPYDYSHRLMGDDGRLRCIVDAFHAAGKVHMVEADTRTFLHPRNEHGRLANRTQSIAAIRREYATALLHGCALWWCDFGADGSGGWYDDPALIEEIRRAMNLAAARLNVLCTRNSQVALVCDLHSCYWLGDGDAMRPHLELVDRVTTELYRTGAPFDTVLLSQLGREVPLDHYRLLIFLNTIRVGPELRRTLPGLLRDKSVLWLWAPGFTDGRQAGPQLVTDLTGFRVGIRGTGEPVRTVECVPGAPLTSRIPEHTEYRLDVRRRTPVPELLLRNHWYNPRTDEVMHRFYTAFEWRVRQNEFVWTFKTSKPWTDIHLRAGIERCDGIAVAVRGEGAAEGAALRVVVKGAAGGEYVAPPVDVRGQWTEYVLPLAGFRWAPWLRSPQKPLRFPLRGAKFVLNGIDQNRSGTLHIRNLAAVHGRVRTLPRRRFSLGERSVPVLTIDDASAVPIGKTPETGRVVMACKGRPGRRHVLVTVPFVPRELLTAFMDEAGVVRYVPEDPHAGVIVRADSRLLMLHTASGGSCDIRLPRPALVRDAVSGKTTAGGAAFSVTLPPDSTSLFELAPTSRR